MSKGKPFGVGNEKDGDGFVGSNGLDWVCKNWKKSDLKYHNFNTSSFYYAHKMLPNNNEVINLSFETIFGHNYNIDENIFKINIILLNNIIFNLPQKV